MMNGPIKDKSAGVVVGPCACGQHVRHHTDDSDRGFMGKLSDKFFGYLRHLAR